MIASGSHKDGYLFKHRGYLGDKILQDNLVLQHSNSPPSLKFESVNQACKMFHTSAFLWVFHNRINECILTQPFQCSYSSYEPLKTFHWSTSNCLKFEFTKAAITWATPAQLQNYKLPCQLGTVIPSVTKADRNAQWHLGRPLIQPIELWSRNVSSVDDRFTQGSEPKIQLSLEDSKQCKPPFCATRSQCWPP
jgi:hypothetical protein